MMDGNGHGLYAMALGGVTVVRDALSSEWAKPIIIGVIFSAVIAWGPLLVGGNKADGISLADLKHGQGAIIDRLAVMDKQLERGRDLVMQNNQQQIQIDNLKSVQERLRDDIERVARIQTEVITTLKLSQKPAR